MLQQPQPDEINEQRAVSKAFANMLAAHLSDRFIVFAADVAVEDIRPAVKRHTYRAIRGVSPSEMVWFVVVGNSASTDDRCWALSGRELLDLIDPPSTSLDVQKIGSLVEAMPQSKTVEPSALWNTEISPLDRREPLVSQRTVIMADGIPEGVVDAQRQPRRPPPRMGSEQPKGLPQEFPNSAMGTGPDKPPTEQYLLAETNLALQVNQPAELRVTISGAPENAQADNNQAARALVNSDKPMVLIVREKGAIRLEDDVWQTTVPVQGPHESVTKKFAYRATGTGRASLSVSLFSDAQMVASVELAILVTGNPQPEAGSQEFLATVEQPTNSDEKRCTLIIDRHGEQLVFSYLDRDQNLAKGRTTLPEGQASAQWFLQLFEQLRGTGRGDQQFRAQTMKGIGNELAQLVPAQIRDLMWEQSGSKQSTDLHSELARWPWELCCLANSKNEIADELPFWGQRGMTRRWANIPHPKRIEVSGNRIVSAPDYAMLPINYLRVGAEEAAKMQEQFGFENGPTRIGDLTKCLNGRDFSIFHFVGHSIVSSDGQPALPQLVLANSKFANQGERLLDGFSPMMLVNSAIRETAPLVFLNACTTGGLYDRPGAVTGFPHVFLKAGAAAFVGTHWKVEEGPAKRFAETFYGEFLEEGSTFSESIATARQTSAEDGWSPTPLAYVAYGHPDARAAE